MHIATLRRRSIRLGVALALMLAPLASMQAQAGLYECTTTTVTTVYRIFGYEVYRSVESTTLCVPL